MKVEVLRFNHIDSQGDIFMPDAIKEKEVPLLKDFDNKNPLGNVEVSRDGNALYAEIDAEKFKGLYPAIGFQSIHKRKELSGITSITEAKLHCVSLNRYPNVDPNIKPL